MKWVDLYGKVYIDFRGWKIKRCLRQSSKMFNLLLQFTHKNNNPQNESW